jgi:hypothetical protein
VAVKKGFYWLVRLVVLAVSIKLALWAWGFYRPADEGEQQVQVLDVDKVCSVIADTGQCFCHHRETERRLSVSYRECMVLAGRH